MIIPDKNSYFQMLEKFEIVPFTQTRGWYDLHSLYKPEKIIFLVNNTDNPTIACFAHRKTFLGLSMILIEGEAYKNDRACNLNDVRSFYKHLTESGFPIIESTSGATYDFEYETALRQAGYLRPVGLFSMPSTKIINLQNPVCYNQNWKRNIRKANENNLYFEVTEKITTKECEDFLKIYSEMTSRKNLSFGFNSEQLFQLLSDSSHFQLFFVKSSSHERIASILIHKDIHRAGLLYAATSQAALETSASFYMYDKLFEYLTSENFWFFDMEKLIPSDDVVNHVFNFKNGIQGTHIQLNGEWSWYKNSFYRIAMYFVKKFLVKKREL